MTAKVKQTQEELEIVRTACKENLKYLCETFLGYKDWDIVHDDIWKFLIKPAKRKMILIPRGHLKTAIVTKAYTIQSLLKDPNLRILIVNQVWDKAREMLSEIKEYLDTKSHLPVLFGHFRSERWNLDEIVISQRRKALSAPSIGTTGVEAEMTSTHYDKIILDDLQGLQNCQTKEQRDKVKRFYKSVLNLLEPGGELIVIGTRWHQDDLYQEILDTEMQYYDVMIRQAIEDGKLIFPKKFSLKFDKTLKSWQYSPEQTMDYINHLKSTLGSDFYSQYMNNPLDEKNCVFRKDYFKYWDRRPDGLFIALTVDPAISLKQEGDFTALVVTGMDLEKNIFVMDYVKGQWTPAQIVENMFRMQSKWHPHAIGLEVLGFQRTLKFALEDEMRSRGNYFPITEIKTSNQISKEYRIKALEPYFKDGRVSHARWMRDMEDELLAFPRGKRDDIIDALAMSLSLLMPGNQALGQPVPHGSWEHFAVQANKLRNPYRDFFHH